MTVGGSPWLPIAAPSSLLPGRAGVCAGRRSLLRDARDRGEDSPRRREHPHAPAARGAGGAGGARGRRVPLAVARRAPSRLQIEALRERATAVGSHVLDLATGSETALDGEVRSVDDQAVWLDDQHVLSLRAAGGPDPCHGRQRPLADGGPAGRGATQAPRAGPVARRRALSSAGPGHPRRRDGH